MSRMALPDVPPPTDLPSPPFLTIPGISNFRDIGGYPCNSSSSSSSNNNTSHSNPDSIRRNLVFRCADPSKVQPEGLAKLNDLGVKKVFDLRSAPEIHREGSAGEGIKVEKKQDAFVTREEGESGKEQQINEGSIERIWCPVFAQRDYGPEQVALRYRMYSRSGSEGFVQAYRDILSNGATAYNTILSHLAQPNPQPCIVHCTAGKDRTGILVALLYLLCDVPAEVIAKEYSLTDDGFKHMRALMMERLLQNPALEGDEVRVKNMMSSKSENMLATIEMIRQEYGSAEAYMKHVVGLSNDQIAQLKKNLQTTEPPVLEQNH